MWPQKPLPLLREVEISPADTLIALKELRDAIEENQKILQGKVYLAAEEGDPDSQANISSAVIDVVWAAAAAGAKAVNNPLGRPLTGAILMMYAGSSRPEFAVNHLGTGFGVTNGSEIVAYAGAITVYEKGLFIATGGTDPETVYRINDTTSGTGFTISPAYTGATAASVNGHLISALDGVYIYFYASSTTNGVWSRWLIF